MKQWICSDTHFGHKNILLFEPERLRQTIIYMFEHIPTPFTDYTEEDINKEIRIYKEAVKNSDNDECKLLIERFLNYHDDMLIDLWNKTIKNEDIVYFLGDLTLTRQMGKIAEIIKRLNGRKIMVMGNHDTRRPLDYAIIPIADEPMPISSYSGAFEGVLMHGFEQVTKRPIILPRNGVNVILMHEPPFDPNLSHEELERDKDGNLIDIHDHTIYNPIYWNPYDIFLFGHVHSNVCQEEIHKNVKCICLDRNNLLPYDLDEVIKEVKKNMKPRNYYVEYLEKIISDFNNDFGTQNYEVDEEVKEVVKEAK